MLSIDDTKAVKFCLAYACNDDDEMDTGKQWEVKVCVLDSTGKIIYMNINLSTKHVSVPLLLRNMQNQRNQSVVELRV